MSIIQVDNQAGKITFSGGKKIIPISQTFKLKIPGIPSVMVWSRPVSIVIQTDSLEERVLPVRDMTRLIQLMIFSLALCLVVIPGFFMQRKLMPRRKI